VVLKHKGVAEGAPAKVQPSFFKPIPGEIEDVVQALPADREVHPDDWKLWRYEWVHGCTHV